MPLIDKYIDELRRSGDTSVILLSESEPRLKGKSAERSLEGKISHKDVTALVEEIIPPECFADLVMMEPVEFPFSHEAGELAIRVVPGPSIWRVVVDVRGDALAPLPAGESMDEGAPSKTLSGLGSGPTEGPADKPADEPARKPADSRADEQPGELELDLELSSSFAPPMEEAHNGKSGALTGMDDDVPLSEMLLADSGDSLDGDDEDIDLASFMPSANVEQPSDVGAQPAAAGSGDLHSASTPPVLMDQDQRSTKRLQDGVPGADPALAGVGAGAGTDLGAGADAEADAVANADDDPGLGDPPSSTAARPVEPLEIDFGDGEEPQFALEALDTLLDAAWGQGATGVLLRDHSVPLMVRGGTVSELPFGSRVPVHIVHDIVDAVASPSQAEQLEIMGQCRFVFVNGSSTRLRCTLIQDGGALAASLRRIGDEHLPDNSSQWMPEAVRKVLPPHGLVLVCGAPGQGRTTTASALAAIAHDLSPQTVVVAEPLERRFVDGGAGLLQRRIPDDVPNCAQALGDVHLLEAPLVLVDVVRPDLVAWDLLSLAIQGRVVIATWTAPDCVEAIQGLMDALPPELGPAERARRVRSLIGVIAVKLVPAASGSVVPIFEVLRTNPALLGAVAESRLDTLRGTEIRQITFESSRAFLKERGLL